MHIRVAIVGCGKISRAHVAGLRDIEGIEIRAVCDRDKWRATDLSRLVRGAPAYADLATMLQEVSPDAVHVLTPPATHAELAIQAMEAGCHVLVEKPMALSVEQADGMIAAAQENKVKLCANHNYLFKPSVAKARQLVESGTIGKIVHVNSFYGLSGEGGSYAGGGGRSHWAYRLPGGVFTNFLPHLIYLQAEFLGHVDAVVGATLTGVQSRQDPTELQVLLEGAGVTGVMSVSMRSKPYVKFVDVYGTRGIIHADLVREVCTLNRERRLPRMLSKAVFSLESSTQLAWGTLVNTMKVISGRMQNMPGLQVLLREFYASIEGGRSVPVPGEEGRRVARIMEMIWSESEKLSTREEQVPVIRTPEKPETDIERALVQRNATLGRVLVTGASGFLGHHLVAALSRCGSEVVALVRDAESVSPELKQQAELAVGDLRNAGSVKSAMQNIDIVYHCAALTTNRATWADHHAINVEGTEVVLQEALRAGAKRVVHISSVIVYGLRRPTNNELVKESDGYAPHPDSWAHYLRSKIEAERLAFRFHSEYRLPVTVLRLGILYGPGGSGAPGRGVVQFGAFNLMVGRGRNRLPYTYVGNAVDCLLLAAVDADAIGQAYNVVDEPQISPRDVALCIADISGESVRFFPLPPVLLMAAAHLLEARATRSASQAPPRLSRHIVASYCRDIEYDTRKARQQLGWQTGVSLQEALRKTIGSPT